MSDSCYSNLILSFFELIPAEVLHTFFFSYLSLFELGNLDTALTNVCVRGFYLGSLQGVVLKDYDPPLLSNICLEFLIRKSISYDEIEIGPFVSPRTIALSTQVKNTQRVIVRGFFVPTHNGNSVVDYHRNDSIKYFDLRKVVGMTSNEFQSICKACPNLTTLGLGDGERIELDIYRNVIQWCPQLCKISLNSDDTEIKSVISHQISTILEQCVNLIYVNANNCINFNDQCVNTLAEYCHSLQTLLIEDCHRITNDAIINLSTKCHNLHTINIDIESFPTLTSISMIHLAQNNPKLSYVEMSPSLSSPSAVLALATCCPQLHTLLFHIDYLLPESYCVIASNCILLHTLTLRRAQLVPLVENGVRLPCETIEAGLTAMAKTLTNLRQLSIEGDSFGNFSSCLASGQLSLTHLSVCLSDTTDKDVQILTAAFPSLRDLTLSNTHSLTDATVVAITSNCHDIRRLDISVCTKLLSLFVEGCPLIKHLYMHGDCESAENLLTEEDLLVFPRYISVRAAQVYEGRKIFIGDEDARF